MELELTQLKTDLIEQQEKNAENIQKYTEINKKYTHCEQHYDKELEIIKVCVEKKNSELRDAQSRMALQAQEVSLLYFKIYRYKFIYIYMCISLCSWIICSKRIVS